MGSSKADHMHYESVAVSEQPTVMRHGVQVVHHIGFQETSRCVLSPAEVDDMLKPFVAILLCIPKAVVLYPRNVPEWHMSDNQGNAYAHNYESITSYLYLQGIQVFGNSAMCRVIASSGFAAAA